MTQSTQMTQLTHLTQLTQLTHLSQLTQTTQAAPGYINRFIHKIIIIKYTLSDNRRFPRFLSYLAALQIKQHCIFLIPRFS